MQTEDDPHLESIMTEAPNHARDMLRATAKLIGLRLICWDEERNTYKIEGSPSRWNPLLDDGDAFRLQMALKPTIRYDSSGIGYALTMDIPGNDQKHAWVSKPCHPHYTTAERAHIHREALVELAFSAMRNQP